MGLVVPGGCTHQMLLETTAVLKAATTRGATPEEIGVSEEAEEDLPPEQAEPVPYAV